MSGPTLLPWPNPKWKENPYQRIVYGGLEAHGVRLRTPPPLFGMLPYWPSADWLHLNWPETLFSRGDAAWRRRALERFAATVSRVKRRGTRVVWTVHNELPHDEPDVDFFRGSNRRLTELADLVHVHFPDAGDTLTQSYGADPAKIVVMEHPTYGSYYGEPVTRDRARAHVGIESDARAVLVFGYVRRYKGIETAIEALARTADERLRLVVAGKPEDGDVVATLQRAAERDPRLVLRLSHVPDEEVRYLFGCADAFLLAGRDFFTSGSIMLALTFGVPVVAAPIRHARILSGRSFFQSWDPPSPERLAEILGSLDGWLATVRADDVSEVRRRFDPAALAGRLATRLAAADH